MNWTYGSKIMDGQQQILSENQEVEKMIKMARSRETLSAMVNRNTLGGSNPV